MTDVTTDRGRDEVELSAADEQLLLELTERARADGLKLTGAGGPLGKLTKIVIARALEGARWREFPEWLPGQDGAYRGRPGGGFRAAGPGFQFRAEDCRQEAAAAHRRGRYGDLAVSERPTPRGGQARP